MRFVTNSFVLLLLTAFALTSSAAAETELTVKGQVRSRTEGDNRSFDPNARTLSYSDLRTRAQIEALVDQNTDVFVQFQDSRRLGGQDASGSDNSGTLNNGTNVDVHQAYIKIRRLWNNGPGLQLGRFEVNFGNQRVFGAVGWSNVGRSWEGVRLSSQSSNHTGQLFWLKRRELNNKSTNSDFDILGVHSDIKSIGLQLLAFYEYDGRKVTDSAGSPRNVLDRINLAAFLKRKTDKFLFEANGVFQTGKQLNTSYSTTLEQDISAFLITAEGRVTLNPENKAWVGAGVDFASGDNDPTDSDFKAYNNLYYTGHKFRGHMDYFIGSNVEGLIDLYLRGSMSPANGWTVSADLHHFSTHEDYMGADSATGKKVGVEIDLYARTTNIKGATAQFGVSVFQPAELYAGKDADPGIWAYLMFTANFGKKVD